ncbi:MAG: hypothetical protein P9L94_02585 [Candidatus Hinthialibacter antarcticus]|nr:hypothetical protein [Candidatus Hinthialibacter antarcticus]
MPQYPEHDNSLTYSYRLQKFFAPILGENVAQRLILNYCSRVNKAPQQLGPEDLKTLGNYLANNMQFFVGRKRARYVISLLHEQAAAAM